MTLLNTDQAAELLGCSKEYIYQLTHYKKIPYYKPSWRRILFSKEELTAWLIRNRIMTNEETQAFAEKKLTTRGKK